MRSERDKMLAGELYDPFDPELVRGRDFPGAVLVTSGQHPDLRLVSVVIPALNGAKTIGLQLEALSRQTYHGPWEVIVIDNGSRDGTRGVVESWTERLPRLRLIEAVERRGANYARNAGCRASGGDVLLFCDADDIVDSDWITAMITALHTYDAVGGGIERRSLNDEIALAVRPPKPVNALLDTFGFLPHAQTANCGVRRELWSRIGGFDENYQHGSDDIEFFWRVQLSGATLGFAPDAVVHYRLRSDLRSIVRQAYNYGRSHTMLFRTFRAAGMPPSTFGQVSREWWWIAAHSPALLGSKRDRAVWLKRVALRWGRIVGSLSNRTFYP
jgi:glycosyltransferase involved in cell wall biosynthesis